MPVIKNAPIHMGTKDLGEMYNGEEEMIALFRTYGGKTGKELK